jgi:hypothetical protein
VQLAFLKKPKPNATSVTAAAMDMAAAEAIIQSIKVATIGTTKLRAVTIIGMTTNAIIANGDTVEWTNMIVARFTMIGRFIRSAVSSG